MGQLNIKKGNHIPPPLGSLGYGFDENGNPVVIKADGTTVIIGIDEENPQNIIANLGVGLESALPSESISAGDVYVTTDTFKIYTALDSVSWVATNLVKAQFVTDVSETPELPPLYQFFNNILMPIANYSPPFSGGLPE